MIRPLHQLWASELRELAAPTHGEAHELDHGSHFSVRVVSSGDCASHTMHSCSQRAIITIVICE